MTEVVNVERIQRDWNKLRGRLVLMRGLGASASFVRVHVIEIGDPDPDVPDRVTYRDYGDSFAARWWELGDQLIEQGIGTVYLTGRVERVGVAFSLTPATADELGIARRAYAAWCNEVEVLNGAGGRAMMELRDQAQGPTTVEG